MVVGSDGVPTGCMEASRSNELPAFNMEYGDGAAKEPFLKGGGDMKAEVAAIEDVDRDEVVVGYVGAVPMG